MVLREAALLVCWHCGVYFRKTNKKVPRHSIFCFPQQWLDHEVQFGTSCYRRGQGAVWRGDHSSCGKWESVFLQSRGAGLAGREVSKENSWQLHTEILRLCSKAPDCQRSPVSRTLLCVGLELQKCMEYPRPYQTENRDPATWFCLLFRFCIWSKL